MKNKTHVAKALLALCAGMIVGAMIASMVACSGVQTVVPFEIGKVAAESILYDARVLQNKGVITPAQFDQVRKTYDQLSAAQSIAIDARKMVIVYNTAENQEKVRLTMNSVVSISTQLLDLAASLGIKGVSK